MGGGLKRLLGCGKGLFLDAGDGDVDVLLSDNLLKCIHKLCNVSICQTAIKAYFKNINVICFNKIYAISFFNIISL